MKQLIQQTPRRALLLSLVTLGVVAALSGGTVAFFSSQASVTGNTFAAGTLDLELTEQPSGSSPQSQLGAQWDFSNMAPGGDEVTSSVWLRNTGSIPGATLNVGIANSWTNPTNIAAQMRITELTLDGQNLLEGGAGATIPEYEGPASCDIEVNFGGNDYTTIGGAVAGAVAGDVICVGPGNYSDSWEPSNPIAVDEEVTIVSTEGPDNTDSVPFAVSADNVTIKGFAVSNPNGNFGIRAFDVNDLIVTQNRIYDVAVNLANGSAQGVYVQSNNANTSGVTITENRIENMGNTNMLPPSSGSSAKGIYIGDTAGNNTIENVLIANNVIDGAYTAQVSHGSGGRGGYGVLVNNGGNTKDMTVRNNTIRNLSGWWSTAIGLEGDTEDAVVILNDIADLNSAGVDNDTGVNFEDNTFSDTVPVNQNNFAADIAGVIINPNFGSFTGTVDATNNWWGSFTPEDQIFENNGTIDTSDFAGGPFVGFVNGTDQNGNGYADLADLQASDITNITPGLDPYDSSQQNDKEFVMSVQLDGPTTDNQFQGLELDEVDIEFTLNQI